MVTHRINAPALFFFLFGNFKTRATWDRYSVLLFPKAEQNIQNNQCDNVNGVSGHIVAMLIIFHF